MSNSDKTPQVQPEHEGELEALSADVSSEELDDTHGGHLLHSETPFRRGDPGIRPGGWQPPRDLDYRTMTQQDPYTAMIRRAVSDADFRESLVANPKATLADVSGVAIPDGVEIVVLENSSRRIHIVLPPTELSLEDLDASGGKLEPGSPEWTEFHQLIAPQAGWLL